MKSSTILAIFLSAALAAAAQTAPSTKPPATAKKSTTSSTVAKKPAAGAAKKPATATPEVTLKDTKDKFSYALGMSLGKNLGTNLTRQEVEFDPDLVARGMKDALVGANPLMTDQEASTVLQQVQTEVREKAAAKRQQIEEENKADATAFFAQNKNKPGVVTLPGGLQYKIITAGTGPKPKATDTVVCNYRGTLLDGKEFDSSYKRGEPATFPVSGVIKGWTEALQLMPVGSKWELYVPSDLAYGERGAGEDITPGSALIFEVELLSIKAPETPAAPAPAEKK